MQSIISEDDQALHVEETPTESFADTSLPTEEYTEAQQEEEIVEEHVAEVIEGEFYPSLSPFS